MADRIKFYLDEHVLKAVRLHASGLPHRGIVYAHQQTSVSHMLRSLMLLHDVLSPDGHGEPRRISLTRVLGEFVIEGINPTS